MTRSPARPRSYAPVRRRYRRTQTGDGPRSYFRRARHLQLGRSRASHRRPSVAKARTRGKILKLLLAIVIAVAVTVTAKAYAIQVNYVPSNSMVPTLCGGNCPGGDDHIVVDKLTYRFHPPRRGDIVVFARPSKLDGQTTDSFLVKRVIAVAGDTVRWQGNTLWLNDVEQHESYVNQSCTGSALGAVDSGQVTVGNGQLFVMGDNRCQSRDSRYFGAITTGSVVGKVFVIIYPWSRVTLL